MKKGNNIIIVATPFSLLCAHELSLKIGMERSKYIYLAKSNNENNAKQIFSVAERLGIDVKNPFGSFSRFNTFKHLCSIIYVILLAIFKRKGVVIVGHWSSTYSQIILAYGSSKLSKWVVDDGAVTIKYPNAMSRKQYEKEILGISTDAANYLRRLIFPVDYGKVNLFTFYNKAVDPMYKPVENRLKEVASRFQKKSKEKIAIFVGSPFVEGGVSESEYSTMIRTCLVRAQKIVNEKMRIIYYAHRREARRPFLYEIFDEVIYASLPLELELMTDQEKDPAIVMGFHSSAIYHCSEIFNIKGIAFWPRDILEVAPNMKISYDENDTRSMGNEIQYIASLFDNVDVITLN